MGRICFFFCEQIRTGIEMSRRILPKQTPGIATIHTRYRFQILH
jgi:hypothetical protein